jgi:hypothetical protein
VGGVKGLDALVASTEVPETLPAVVDASLKFYEL